MKLITNTDITIFPYNDVNMVYDLDTRQYLLTVSGVKSLLGFNLEELTGSKELADIFCLEISDIVYNYIYSSTSISKIKYKRWIIAKNGDLRLIFKRILSAQMRYSIRSGANLLGDMHGVNFERGKALSIDSIRGRIEISSQALKMLTQSGLLYSGFISYINYEEEDTF